MRQDALRSRCRLPSRRWLPSRRGMTLLYSILIAVILGVLIFWIYSMLSKGPDAPDYSRPLGQPAVDIALAGLEGEISLLYLDLSAKLASLQAIHELGMQGGYHSQRSSPCGMFAGTSIWYKDDADCNPGIATTFSPVMGRYLDQHLAQYKALAIPLNNYNTFELQEQHGYTEIIGQASRTIGATDQREPVFSAEESAAGKRSVAEIDDAYGSMIDDVLDELADEIPTGAIRQLEETDVPYIPPKSLMIGIMAQESSGNSNSESNPREPDKSCNGLYQFCGSTAYDYDLCDCRDRATGSACTASTKSPDYCVNVDYRKDERKSVRAAAIYLTALIRDFHAFTSPETRNERYKFAVAGYNAGPGVVRQGIAEARRVTDTDEVTWAQVSAALHPSMVRIGDEDFKEFVIEQVIRHVPAVYSFVLSYEQLQQEAAGGGSTGGSGTGGGIAPAAVGITGSVLGLIDHSILPPKPKSFAQFEARYAVKPSFRTRINYSFSVYDELFAKAKLLTEQCVGDLTVSCVMDALLDPANEMEQQEVSSTTTPAGPPLLESTEYNWIVLHNDEVISESPGTERDSVYWEIMCEPDEASIVDDFLLFYQNCYYSDDTDCLCTYPASSREYDTDFMRISISQEGLSPTQKRLRLTTALEHDTFTRELVISNTAMFPIVIDAYTNGHIMGRRLSAFRLAFKESGIVPVTGLVGTTPFPIDTLRLYKAPDNLYFANEDRSSLETWRMGPDGNPMMQRMPLAGLDECQPAPVLRMCVIDNSRKNIVYDRFEDRAVHAEPLVKFSMFVKDTVPPPPLTGLAAFDVTTNEDSLVLRWDKSPAPDVDRYELYSAPVRSSVDPFGAQGSLVTRPVSELRDDSLFVERTDILLDAVTVVAEADIVLSSCEFDYASQECYYQVVHEGERKLMALEPNRLYTFITPENRVYHVYRLEQLDNAFRHAFSVTAVDKSGNQIDNAAVGQQMPYLEAPVIDDLPPDLVSYQETYTGTYPETVRATLNPAGMLRLSWLDVETNLDQSPYTTANRGGYLVYGSCDQPSWLPETADQLINNGNDGNDGNGGNDAVPLSSYAHCSGFADAFDIWFAVVAQDSKQNPAEDAFTQDVFSTWRAWGMPLVRVTVPTVYLTELPDSTVMLTAVPDVEPDAPLPAIEGTIYDPDVTVGIEALLPQWPVGIDPVVLSSCYGWRMLESGGDWTDGIDIAVGEGTPVYAVEDGTVEALCVNEYNKDDSGYARQCSGFGTNILMKHSDTLYTRYSHLSPDVTLEVGQEVAVGDVIARSGNTGHSFGPHLDFKVYFSSDFSESIGDYSRNPLCYLPDVDSVEYTAGADSCRDADGNSVGRCPVAA